MLMEMHRTKRLPVVIFRPGIVIGQYGTPFHWGVGMWITESVVRGMGRWREQATFCARLRRCCSTGAGHSGSWD